MVAFAKVLFLAFFLPAATVGTERGQEVAVVQDRDEQSGWLGVSIQDISSEIAKAMSLNSRDGALVNDVEKESPAETAGIKEKDVIVELNGRKVYDSDDLVKVVRRTKPGSKVSLVVLRGNERKTLQVTVGEQPRRYARSFSFSGPGGHVLSFGSAKKSGIEARELNEQLAEYFQAPEGKGVYVERVTEGSTAEKAGVKAGDVIVSVNKKRIRSLNDLWRALDYFDPGETVDVEVLRKGTAKLMVMEIGEDEGTSYHFRTTPRFRMFRNNDWLELPDPEEIRARIAPMKPELDRLRIELEHMGRDIKERIQIPLKEKRVLHRKVKLFEAT